MFKLIGIAYQNGEKRKIHYGEFNEYQEAYDYKRYLEDGNNWTNNDPNRPYMLYIEDIQ